MATTTILGARKAEVKQPCTYLFGSCSVTAYPEQKWSVVKINEDTIQVENTKAHIVMQLSAKEFKNSWKVVI